MRVRNEGSEGTEASKRWTSRSVSGGESWSDEPSKSERSERHPTRRKRPGGSFHESARRSPNRPRANAVLRGLRVSLGEFDLREIRR